MTNAKFTCSYLIITITALLLLPNSLSGQCNTASFGGGDGTSASPYLISNSSHLNNVRNCLNNANVQFRQTAHIDLNVSPYNSGAGWDPIGSETQAGNEGGENRFRGTYDGNGYMIQNLFINRPTQNNVGLFGVVGASGVIRNVHISGVNVKGSRGTGSLAGRTRGLNTTIIEFSSAVNGTVTGHAVTGGLVGGNNSFITSPGQDSDRPIIRRSYAIIDVRHEFQTNTGAGILEKFGGLVGCNQKGLTQDSFARGSVVIVNTSSQELRRVGGLAGCADERGRVERSYSTGQVQASVASGATGTVAQIGGFLGNLSGTGGGNIGTAADSYWDTDTSGLTGSAGLNNGVFARNTTQMKTQSNFTNWDFTNIWQINSNINDGYPFLRGLNIQALDYFSRNNGNWTNPATWSNTSCGGSAGSGTPGPDSNVIICSGTTVTIETNDTVQDYASITVETGGILTVSSGATIGNGDITLNSDGLFCNFSSSNPTLQLLRNLNARNNNNGQGEGWRYLSSPVSASYSELLGGIWTQGATGASFAGGTPNVYIWPDNQQIEPHPETYRPFWAPQTNLNSSIPAGRGTLVYVYESDFDGANAGWGKILSVNGQENGNLSFSPNNTTDGWSLLGNPYACSISYSDLNSASSNGLTSAVYVWDPNTESGAGGQDPDPNITPTGSWRTYTTTNGGNGDLTNGIIMPFQAFFVQNNTTNPTVVFNNSVKETETRNFLGKEAESQNMVRMEVNGQSMSNSTWLSFSDSGDMRNTDGDAWQLQPMSSDYVWLASRKTDGIFDIGHYPLPEYEFSMPLEIQATRPGKYTITATEVRLSGYNIIFHDLHNSFSVPIDESFSYTFTLDVAASKQRVINPFELANNGNLKAKADGQSRFLITTFQKDSASALPQYIKLNQNYPNPFNPSTIIRFELPNQSNVRLEVYDMTGRMVAILAEGQLPAGVHHVNFDGTNLSSGIYLYRLEASGIQLTKKLTLIK